MNNLKLLKGDPIQTSSGVYIYPLKLEQVSDIGLDIYNNYMSTLLIDKTLLDFKNMSESEIERVNNLSELELTLEMSLEDNRIFTTFISALELFLQADVEVVKDVGIVIKTENKSFVLDNDIFLQIREIIRLQNYLNEGKEDVDFKPANDKAKELRERMNKAKEKLQQQNKEEGLSLFDIISIVATYSNDVNIISVWKLTVYQLYVSYLRLILWDEYHNNFTLLPHVSADEQKELSKKHWAVDINKMNK